MKNKFTVGSQWLTKGGWPSVVVKIGKIDMLVWHDKTNDTYCHKLDGSVINTVFNDFTLRIPYTIPREETVWVNVFLSKKTNKHFYQFYFSQKDFEKDAPDGKDIIIASFKYNWIEGEKINEKL
jgi:hypothetical protein